ncbi:hypothetical protein [Telluria beijingensis]|uniref:hypothetical protein n=1 Tax=Telluria beijingensis TaxID=3068633 RepID=UPI002795D76E|nr:hypothetical protein [Massilia sp. REN29]
MIQALVLTLDRLSVQVGQTAHAPDKSLAGALCGLVASVERAFRQEDALMEETGYRGLHVQRKDNAPILCALRRADARVEHGDMAIGREMIAALPGLLSLHRTTALGMLNHSMGGDRGCVVMRSGRIRIRTAPRYRPGRGQ